MFKFISRTENMPVGAIATCVGLGTLSAVYGNLGFMGARHLVMAAAILVWLGALVKLTRYRKTFAKDYSQVVPGSLYATFAMLTMIIGSYLFMFNQPFGKALWLAGIILQVIHILVFSYRNLFRNLKMETFVPTWFVTYVGFLVSVTVGVEKGMPNLLLVIVYYGFVAYVILFPFLVYRLIKYPLPPALSMTRAIFLAPNSLVLVGYLTVAGMPQHALEPNHPFVFAIYGLLFVTLFYVAWKLPAWLRAPFNPGFSALTFPTAIALVATNRMFNFLLNNGYETLGNFLRGFFGVQLWVTTALISYVAYGFLRLLFNSEKT